jgi:hypothetical protein
MKLTSGKFLTVSVFTAVALMLLASTAIAERSTYGMFGGSNYGMGYGHGMFGAGGHTMDYANMTNASADRAIDRRIEVLDYLNASVQSRNKIQDADKTNLTNAIQNETANLTSLKAKIDADNDSAMLSADTAVIGESDSVLMLLLPQVSIAASADRILTSVDQMNNRSAILQTNISDAKNVGNNTTALDQMMTDYNANVSDAVAETQAATSEVFSLTPDNGNTTQMDSNNVTIGDARTKIKTAQKDLKVARSNLRNISWGLKQFTEK